MKKILPCAIVLFSLIACNSNQPDQDPSIRVAPSTTKTDSVGQQTSTANPAIAPVQPATAPTQVQTVQTAPTTAGLNPAHGQPNHRCDIAVGAPLSTPIQTGAQPQQTIQQVPAGVKPSVSTGATPTAIPNGSTAKLNPPHGEPGHDCKIPVGQPLN
ncbi:hypothetical protein [Ferruginibacter sp. HRS2-29]|uniref:hypothetical protein n=1 Tax=Ferruginibacter sp. HRS2-29 TaxID=2487334 RepID=UPI0020CDF407|nr:hypothetical protein [Ferruginibacter sp. HRS2-29]MCP9752914.1 hypothetical protein [Ferruginibacter sp. HRS2-29]